MSDDMVNDVATAPGEEPRPSAGSGKWPWLLGVVVLVCVVAAVLWARSSTHRSETAARQKLAAMQAIAVADGHGRIATLNLQLIKDSAKLSQAIELAADLPYLEVLDASNTSLSDDDLVWLEGMSELNSLHLNGTQVTDAGLPSIAKISGLEGLQLARTDISDSGLESIAQLTGLKQLDLSNTNLSGDLTALDPLDQLQWLLIVGVPIGDSAAAALQSLDALNRITVGKDRLTSPEVAAIVEAMPKKTFD